MAAQKIINKLVDESIGELSQKNTTFQAKGAELDFLDRF